MRSRSLSCALGLVLVVVACGSEGRERFDVSEALPGEGSSRGGFDGAQGCSRGGTVCVGNDVHACSEDGGAGGFLKSCDATGQFCAAGACSSGCDAAEKQPTNVGCEFWAVDLKNESGLNDAAAAPWGIVVSNFGQAPAQVAIEKNDAPLGAAPAVTLVASMTLAPGELREISLPTREVDGTVGKTPGSGTALTSNAYKIRTSAPVVVYQFNTLKNSFSNDASLLLPKNALGSVYRVLGWPAANGIVVPGLPAPPGVPDHSYVTIVGTQAGTKVKVQVANASLGNGTTVPARKKGEIIEAVLGPFDVLNVASDGFPADMTGSVVESSAPVAVFSGSERGVAPGVTDKMPAPPSFVREGMCCSDHLEEQMLPVTSYGRKFVLTRSPIRSTGGYAEPDVIRFMGVAVETTVTTTLPKPFDAFTLKPGEIKDAWAQDDFIVTATEPVAVAQILVSQGFTNAPKWGGDPSLTIFPPVDQYRRDYLFNVPSSWEANFVVVAAPEGAKVTIDGQPPVDCVVAKAGALDGTTWEARRCPVSKGAHRVAADVAVGIVAYGYGNVGSYAFVGGANVRKIYEPPPLVK